MDLQSWKPDEMDDIDRIQGQGFGATNPIANLNLTPTVGQQAVGDISRAKTNPFQNAQNNFTKTLGDFTSPQGDNWMQNSIKAYSDMQNLKSNPFGSQQNSSIPMPTAEHLGPANDKGIQPVLSSFHPHLQQASVNANNNFGIKDNTSLLAGTQGSNAPSLEGQTTFDQSKPQQNIGLGKKATTSALSGAAGLSEATASSSGLASLLGLLA